MAPNELQRPQPGIHPKDGDLQPELGSFENPLRDLQSPARLSTPQMNGDAVDMDEPTKYQVFVPEKRGWKKFLAFVGPGFLVCIAYIDPGNFESDLQAGAEHRYELLWIILIASVAALFMQSLAANLGVVTGKHLAEHCRTEYPSRINIILWVFAEFAVIAADIPEVIGTAFALNILFRIPVWAGVLITGCSTFLLLAVQQYGVRKLEFIVGGLVFTMAACFLVELGYSKPDPVEVIKGLFIPRLNGSGSTALAISLLGAMVMPHNLFLHSALVLTRNIPRSNGGIKMYGQKLASMLLTPIAFIHCPLVSLTYSAYVVKDGCRYYFLESASSLFVAFLINVSVISVSGAVCNNGNLSNEDRKACESLDLNHASFLLRNVLGNWSKIVFGIALLASGQSSTITGTYAGQYVMQGFLNLRFKPWLRNLLTRCVAITPSLIVSIIQGSAGAGKLIIISSMILAFELPFSLIPLLKFTTSKTKMGPHANSWPVTLFTWGVGIAIISINIYYLSFTFIGWLLKSSLVISLRAVIGAIVFSCILAYLVGIIYLTLRPVKEVTYLLPPNDDEEEDVNEELEFGPDDRPMGMFH